VRREGPRELPGAAHKIRAHDRLAWRRRAHQHKRGAQQQPIESKSGGSGKHRGYSKCGEINHRVHGSSPLTEPGKSVISRGRQRKLPLVAYVKENGTVGANPIAL
jgi:hypothetical protein